MSEAQVEIETPTGQLHGRLAGLSLPKQVFVLSIWPLAEQVLNFTVGFVDMALAARLEPQATGVAAADAIGIAGMLMWLLGMLQATVATGAAVMVARGIGGGRKSIANAALGQAVTMIGLLGIACAVLMYAGADGLAMLIGAEGLSRELCVLYLHIVTLAVPFSTQLFICNASLRAAGNPRTPFVLMLLVNAVNVAVSVTLVQLDFGVKGIAIGTCCAWVTGALLAWIVLIRGKSGLRLRWLRMRPHWHTARRILRVGIPSLVESLGMWSGSFVMMSIIGRMGKPEDGLIGIFNIAVRIESISFMGGFAIGMAAATLAGQYLGAGNPKRAQQAVMLCWGLCTALMCFGSVLFLLFPEALAGVATDQPLHLATVPTMVRLCAFSQPFFATTIVFSSAMRGAGDTRTPMLATYIITYLVRVPWVYVAGIVMGWSIVFVWLGLVCEWVVRASLFAFFFFRGRWRRVEV